jgi:hypothetical protein
MTFETLTQAALTARDDAARTGERHVVTKSPYAFHAWPVSLLPIDLPERHDPTFNQAVALQACLNPGEALLAVVHPSGRCTFRSRC